MSSVNSGMGLPPIVSSVSGISSSGKGSSTEKTRQADGSAAKVVDSAQAEATGLMGSEKSEDRDADGRQLYQSSDSSDGAAAGQESRDQPAVTPPRAKDPEKQRGSRLDLDV